MLEESKEYIASVAFFFCIIGSLLIWQRRPKQSVEKVVPVPVTDSSTGRDSNKLDHIVEICVSDIESAYQSWRGGANSLELCSNRLEGGVTPSTGLIEECIARFQMPGIFEVHVLIRPRPGDFFYSDAEFDVILRDITLVKHLGATGVVIGLLDKEGHVDKERMRIVRKLTAGMSLTFHRAFDVSADDEASKVPCSKTIQDILDIGCDRLLTSGKENTASEGTARLKQIMQLVAGTPLQVVAACGISADTVSSIIQSSAVHGVHAGSAVCIKRFHQNAAFSAKRQRGIGQTGFLLEAFDMEFMQWDAATEDKVSAIMLRAWEAWGVTFA